MSKAVKSRWCFHGFVLIAGCADAGGAVDSAPHVASGGILFGDVQPCDAPAASPSWQEVGASMGLRGAADPDGAHTAGGAAALADLDGDGERDLAVWYPGRIDLYWGMESPPQEISLDDREPVFLLSVADIDNDGRVELFRGGSTPVMYRFGADRSFEQLYPLGAEFQGTVQSLSPGDADADGWIDRFYMLVPEPTGISDALVIYNRDTEEFNVDNVMISQHGKGERLGFDALWFDRDGDGDQDVYVVNDQGHLYGGNVLYDFEDGALLDASDACSCDLIHSGMGADVGDYDRDGVADLYVTATGGNSLLRGEGDGSFVDVATSVGADPIDESWRMAWGGIWLDLDNDGDLDLLNALGDLWGEGHGGDFVEDLPISLLVQADGLFSEAAPALGLDAYGSWRGLIAEDLNSDGVLDLIVTDVVERPQVFLSEGCTAEGWLVVEVPEGAKVEVLAEGEIWTDWASSHSGFAGAQQPKVHFGLGEHQVLDGLRISLGARRFEMYEAFEARREIRVTSAALGKE